MKLNQIEYRPYATILFTSEEVAFMMRAAEEHYDAYCRSIAQQGGFLFGIKNAVEHGAAVTLSSGQVDTLCKVTETDKFAEDINRDLRRTFVEIADAHLKVKPINFT